MKIKALVLVGLLVSAVYAQARPAFSYAITYYSDESHTTVVGRGEFTCNGNWHLFWGIETGYVDEYDEQKCSYSYYEPIIGTGN